MRANSLLVKSTYWQIKLTQRLFSDLPGELASLLIEVNMSMIILMNIFWIRHRQLTYRVDHGAILSL